MYSYCEIDGSRLVLEDIYSGKDSEDRSVQFVKLRYKDKTMTEKLRVNVYPGINTDKLPYFLLEGRVIYLEDMTDVYGK